MTLRSIAIILIATAASAADLVAYSPTDGTTWVGWYDSQSRTFACPKPAVVLTLPEGARIAPAKPPEGETPEQLKARGDALVKLGTRVRRDSTNKASAEVSRMRAADGEEMERKGGALIEQAMAIQRALEETAKAARAATAAAAASAPVAPGAPPEFASMLIAVERARNEVTRAEEAVAAARREQEAAERAVMKCTDAIDRKILETIMARRDFSRVSIAIVDDASRREADAVIELNRDLDSMATESRRRDFLRGVERREVALALFLGRYGKFKPGWGWINEVREAANAKRR